MSEKFNYLQQLKESDWVQDIPADVIASDFADAGTYDVDQRLLREIKNAVYFLQYPEKNVAKENTPKSFSGAIDQARQQGVIIGFSGYASGGKNYNYDSELDAVDEIFQNLLTQNIPVGLAMHGGTREGIPVIANLVAQDYKVSSMGVLPLRGLDWLPEPALDYLVVDGQNWGDESETLGKTPDILFLFGGGANALKDCQAALQHNKQVVAIRSRTYPENSAVNQLPSEAFGATCSTPKEIQQFIASLKK